MLGPPGESCTSSIVPASSKRTSGESGAPTVWYDATSVARRRAARPHPKRGADHEVPAVSRVSSAARAAAEQQRQAPWHRGCHSPQHEAHLCAGSEVRPGPCGPAYSADRLASVDGRAHTHTHTHTAHVTRQVSCRVRSQPREYFVHITVPLPSRHMFVPSCCHHRLMHSNCSARVSKS